MSPTESSPQVLLIGNPNSGKSLLFNALTGLHQQVANFPGITVEIHSGECENFTLLDFPGVYSLHPLTRDEVVAVSHLKTALEDPRTAAVTYVMDVTRFERSLFLLLQLKSLCTAAHRPLLVAMNMIDELVAKQIQIPVQSFADALNLEVIPISAKTGLGLSQLKNRLLHHVSTQTSPPQKPDPTPAFDSTAFRLQARELARKYGPQNDLLLVGQNRLDAIFLSPLLGVLIFSAIMLFLFQAIFSWAAPFMDGISWVVSALGTWTASHLPSGIFADFIRDAVFEGVGSFLTFAPQIFILFLIIGALEDSGYLARTTIMFHRPLSFFGLTGRSFVPFLSGHACAIPAILATRTIESPLRRWVTILTVPFMSCSARIPVYALLIAAFVPPTPLIGHLVTYQGLAFFLLYALGLITGLIAARILAWALQKKFSNSAEAPFVVELPPYRIPSWRPILRHSLTRTWDFVQKAGGIIFIVTVCIWMLGYFPHGAGHLQTSYLAQMGRALEPLTRPLGMDWKIAVSVLTSFLAREVFVGTLGTLYGMENVDENIQTLTLALKQSDMKIASAIALLVFFALSMQCVSTLAVIGKETHSRWVPVMSFIAMTLIAYGASALAYFLFV